MRTRVKICGITNLADALDAIEAGADALGFVFYKKSPRYITPLEARAIIEQLPPFVERVGLFVNHSADQINQIAQESGISLAQIHFEAEAKLYEEVEIATMRVVRARSQEDIFQYKDHYRIVDAFVESYGGEGKRIDLNWFKGVDCSKIILAGGLSAQNIAKVLPFGFYGVDLSSSVEKSKGKKDKMKINEFMKAIDSGSI